MEAALKAISNPTRREILRLVQNDEKPAGEIASNFPISRPAISQHLTVLKFAGLIDERRSGVKRLYRTRVEGMAELKEFLDNFWDNRLERLKSGIEAAEVSRMEPSWSPSSLSSTLSPHCPATPDPSSPRDIRQIG